MPRRRQRPRPIGGSAPAGVTVNGDFVSAGDFSDNNPSPPGGSVNVVWDYDPGTGEVSASVPNTFGSGNSDVTVNGGGTVASANFNASTPAAPASALNVTWQSAGGISAYVAKADLVTLLNLSAIEVNGGGVRAASDFGASPAAPGSATLVTWQASGNNVSGYVDLSSYGVGDSDVTVNGGGVRAASNLNASTPAAPASSVNLTWQASGSDVSGYIAKSSILTLLGYLTPPAPTHTVKGVCWMAGNAAVASTTQAISGNQCKFGMHFEEHDLGHTYDAIGMFSSSGVGNNAKTAIYSVGSNGNPSALLWSSAVSSTNTANTNHIFTFAGGTWTAAGATYKDGSNRLVLTRGQAIYTACMTDGNVTWRVLNGVQVRNFGISTDTTTGYQGFTENQTYPTFTDPATPVSLTAQLPCMVLRFI